MSTPNFDTRDNKVSKTMRLDVGAIDYLEELQALTGSSGGAIVSAIMNHYGPEMVEAENRKAHALAQAAEGS